eukprot:14681225-Alexandrium_andersonii.AAC.1
MTSTDQVPDDVCPICLGPGRGAAWMRMQCGHTFHFGCVARHRAVGKDARRCLCCRGDIVSSDWQRLGRWEGIQDAAAPAVL